jgi:hypothetical protein
MTRDVARRLLFLLLRASSASAAIAVAGGAIPACYTSGGGGSDPPTTTFYFPVGLAVSSGGNALYAVNSDFDLQWNGGTLQSYDLFKIRQDAARLIHANLSGQSLGVLTDIDFVTPQPTTNANCLGIVPPDAGPDSSVQIPRITDVNGTRIPPGEICAPPVQSTNYVRSSAIIGAFATDLQIQTDNSGTMADPGMGVVGHRLFAPVRGDATVTWADVGVDDNPMQIPPEGASAASFPPFVLDCGQPGNGTPCDSVHRTGNPPDPADTRLATMPGEPFGMAQSQDGSAIAVTHQTSTDASLLLAGSPDVRPPAGNPSMQFVETDVVNGGSGITFVPHDVNSSVPPCQTPPLPGVSCVGPAFLETSHTTAEIDLLRYYSDDGSSLHRPFIAKEAAITFDTNLGGTDSRGIAIDPTPRYACGDTPTCGDLPARVFFANRTPPSLVIGEIGGPSTNGYNPDQLTLSGNLPLPAGPSRVYVAPIVNPQGNFEVRVFIVNFDSSTISVYDPNCGGASSTTSCQNLALVDTIYVGPGPFAMAFDPFSLEEVAKNASVESDPRQIDPTLRRYRFGYVASFTDSYVQVIDLDQSQPTFESVVFTLGNPTPPKGS